MDDQIIPADKQLRRRVLVWGGAVVVAGVGALLLLRWMLRVPADPTDAQLQAAIGRAFRAAALTAWLTGVCFVLIGVWFLRLGYRIRCSGRFPPPGMKVIRDTAVRTGSKAQGLATLATVTGLATALLGATAAWHLYRLAVAVLNR